MGKFVAAPRSPLSVFGFGNRRAAKQEATQVRRLLSSTQVEDSPGRSASITSALIIAIVGRHIRSTSR